MEKAGEILCDVSLKADKEILNENNILNNLNMDVLRQERELISQDDWAHYVLNYFPFNQINHGDSTH